MTDIEKLVDLLWQCVDIDTPFGEIADFLIANGVRLERKQATSEENKQWIPVSERLPDWRDGKVLVSTKYGFSICERTVNGRWKGQHANWITHWMPLPEPPKEEK